MAQANRGLSIRAYAAHRKRLGLRGATPAAVQKALNDGRITKGPDGKIHPVDADRDWETNTRPERRGPSIGESRAVREAYLAQGARLDYLERVGTLINAAEAEREYFEVARVTREKLLAVPGRVAGEVAASDDPKECEAILEREIRAALSELAGPPG